MPYKRSTQSYGFRGRQTFDPSKELQDKAKALDNQRVEIVKGYEKAANQQLAEMQRIDNVMTSNDKFELAMLAENSQHFKNLLNVSAETIGKKLVADKRQEGIDTFRAAQAGDAEAQAKVELSKKQVDEIEIKMAELEAKTEEITNFDPKKVRLSLEQQAKAENIRKLGRQVAYGYKTAAMSEAVKGYIPWFLDQQNNPDAIHYNDTVNIIIDGEPIALKVGDYNKYTNRTKQQAIEDYLEFEYIGSNTPENISSTIVEQYLNKDVVTATDKYRNNKFKQEVVTNAQQEIRDRSLKFYSDVKNIDVNDPESINKLKARLETMFSVGPSAHFRAGTGNEGPTRAYKKQIIEDLKTAYMLADEEQQLELDKLITKTELEIAGMGTTTIEKWGTGDFDLATLKAEALEKGAAARVKIDKIKTQELKLKGTDLQNQLDNGEITQIEYDTAVAGLQETYGSYTGWGAWGATKLIGYKPKFISEAKADKHAKQLQDTWGYIPNKEIGTWSTASRDKHKDQIVDDEADFTPTTTAKIKDYGKEYERALTDIAKKLLTAGLVTENNTVLNRITHAKKSLIPLATKLKSRGYTVDGQGAPAGTGLSWYIDQAHIMIMADIGNATSKEHKNGEYYFSINEGGFVKGVLPKPVTNESLLYQQARDQDRDLTQAKFKINNFNGDVLGTTLITDDIKTLEPIRHDGVVQDYQPWIKKLSDLDPYDRTPFEILNLQRVQAGLKPIPLSELPPGEAKIQQLLQSTYPEVRAMLKTGDVRTVNRALDKMGLVDVKGMYSVMDQMMDGKIVSDGELPSLLNEMGITSDAYDSSEEIRDKVARFKVNKILKIASGQTNNRAELIRRTAIGLKYGEEEMDNWGEGAINNQDAANKNNFSLRAYNGYLTGEKDSIKGDAYGTVEVVTAGVGTGRTIDTVTTRDVVNQKLINIKAQEPPERIPERIYGMWPIGQGEYRESPTRTVYNPAHAKWKKEVQLAEDHIRLLDLFENEEALKSIWWGTRLNPQSEDAQILVRSILGKEVMDEIYEEAASNVGYKPFLPSQTTGRVPIAVYARELVNFRGTEATHGPFAREVERLLMLRPELQADYIKGN